MDRLGLDRATCTLHLISVPDQPGRKQMYHYISEAKSLLYKYILWLPAKLALIDSPTFIRQTKKLDIFLKQSAAETVKHCHQSACNHNIFFFFSFLFLHFQLPTSKTQRNYICKNWNTLRDIFFHLILWLIMRIIWVVNIST